MADQNQVNLTLAVQTAQALQSLQDFQNSARQTLDQVQAGTGKIKDGFDTIKGAVEAAIAAFAIEKVAEFFKGSIDLAAEQEKQITRLSAAMAQTGEYSEAAVEGMKDFAGEMQRTTSFGEDAVVSQLAFAKSLGLTNDQSKELVKVAADLAVATGDTLDGAVAKLGKTYSGSAGRMGQMFPVLKALSAEQLEAGDGVKALGDRLQGMAEAQLDTYSGSVAQASHAFDDFRKALGSVFTDSPAMIARLQGMRDMWTSLKEWTEKNRETLEGVVNFGFKALATVGPVVLDVIKGLMLAFEGFVVVGAKLWAALQTGAADTLSGLKDGFDGIVDVISGFFDGIVSLVDEIPGLGDALEGMGVDVDGVTDALHGWKDSADSTAKDTVANLRSMGRGTDQFAKETLDSFYKVNKTFDEFEQHVEDGAQKVFDAAEKAGKAKQEFINGAPGDRLGGDKFDPDRLADEWQSLYDKLTAEGMTASEKREAQYQQEMLALGNAHQEMLNRGMADEGQYEEAKAALEKHYDELRDAEAEADYQKNAARIKGLVTEAANQPGAFMIKSVGIEADAFDDFRDKLGEATQEAIGLGVGVLNNVLGGAKGAQDMFKSAAGAFADALIPGLGPAVSSILGTILQGPDAVKAQVKAFIAAIPEIMNAIGASIPALVEGFIEAFKDPKTWAGFGEVVADMMTGFAPEWAPELGKQMGIRFGDSLNSPNFSRTVHGWFSDVEKDFGKLSAANFSKGIESAGKELESLPSKISSEIFVKLPGQIRDGFTQAIAALRQFVLSIPDILRGFIMETIPKAFGVAIDALKNFFSVDAANDLRAAGGQIAASVKQSISEAFNGIKAMFDGILGPIKTALNSFKIPDIPTPGWLKSFEDLVNKLTNWSIPGTGGGGGGGEVGKLFSTGHFATGITEVPGGFPNDTFPSMLSSGERVVDSQTNQDLKRFLSGQGGGGETAALLGQILSVLQAPQTVPVQVKIGSDKIADVMLKLSRTNARVSA